MIASQPRYSREEFARRGQEIYLRDVLPFAQSNHQNEFVAIDIETGEYQIDQDDYTATEHLLIRQPNAQIWLARVGYAATYRVGGPRTPKGKQNV